MDRCRLREAGQTAVIYELLVRDWDAAKDFDAVVDRLDVEWLGITAIELMPVSEFDGNSSWGYNPGPRFAVDKAYGTEAALKRLVDAAHARDRRHPRCGAQPDFGLIPGSMYRTP